MIINLTKETIDKQQDPEMIGEEDNESNDEDTCSSMISLLKSTSNLSLLPNIVTTINSHKKQANNTINWNLLKIEAFGKIESTKVQIKQNERKYLIKNIFLDEV